MIGNYTKGPSIFVNHGGGPYPLLQPEHHAGMYLCLKGISSRYPKPTAIVVISAHWQEQDFTILDCDEPGLLFDYYDFPPQSYLYKYPIGSTPELRKRVVETVGKHQIKLEREFKRGYDHGVFIPLMIIYPKADIPVIQISLLNSMDPQKHYRLGQALAELRSEGFMILGSGATFHNFSTPNPQKPAKQFQSQLVRVCCRPATHEKRLVAVSQWMTWKAARECHGEEQHLIPLFVNLGAGEEKAGSFSSTGLYGYDSNCYMFE